MVKGGFYIPEGLADWLKALLWAAFCGGAGTVVGHFNFADKQAINWFDPATQHKMANAFISGAFLGLFMFLKSPLKKEKLKEPKDEQAEE